MNYNWINLNEIPNINDCRIVLFGAGAGSEEFLDLMNTDLPNASILSIADNDVSIHGKSFYGYDIIHPDQLINISFDMIVVTSISGRDAISAQLDSMGYQKNYNYFTVGRYPVSFIPAFDLVKEHYLMGRNTLEDTVCLHIGPGGNFGLEVLLYCYGVDTVYSIDKYLFGIQYPDITNSFQDYDVVRRYIESIVDDSLRQFALKRFQSVIIRQNDRIYLDKDKIKFCFPMDLCKLSFEDGLFDFVFSSGVLEHVEQPDFAVSEIMRVLKPGGITLNRVITRDHRSFSKSSGCHAFSFRNYGEDEWQNISLKKFYQNRILPVEWKNLFIQYGLSLDLYDIEEEIELDDPVCRTFHTDFFKFTKRELGALNCVISGKQL